MSAKKAKQLIFQTPAKINTFLFIQKKRSDGYHELLMDLIPISFYDTIELIESDTKGISLVSNLQGVPVEENLVIKAIRLLEKEIRHQFSLTVKLTKLIPSGAGLGGGSGNAAGILKVLNDWYHLDLQDHKLAQLALKLGADVPFFINPRPSLAKGIGEQLIELPNFEPLNILLLNPGFPISTGKAYASCQISGRTQAIQQYTPEYFSNQNPGINDFWSSLEKEYSELTTCRQALMREGAVFSGLSGSGSTIFGIFENNVSCKSAYKSLNSSKRWNVVQCKTLQSHNYFPVN